jgi:hypothetical protein
MPDSSFDNTNETQQAQHSQSNDTPTDVNMNAVVGRSQALTFDMLGKGFAASADRRAAMFDQKAYGHKDA